VTVPGKINFFGSTLAGIPMLRAGFNEHLGWVTTNNAPDVMDVFALRLDPGKKMIKPSAIKSPCSRITNSDRYGSPKRKSRPTWKGHTTPGIGDRFEPLRRHSGDLAARALSRAADRQKH
jgi:hypothetical protein